MSRCPPPVIQVLAVGRSGRTAGTPTFQGRGPRPAEPTLSTAGPGPYYCSSFLAGSLGWRQIVTMPFSIYAISKKLVSPRTQLPEFGQAGFELTSTAHSRSSHYLRTWIRYNSGYPGVRLKRGRRHTMGLEHRDCDDPRTASWARTSWSMALTMLVLNATTK